MKQKFKIVLAVVIAIAFIVSLIYLSQSSKPKLAPLAIVSSTPSDHGINASLSDPLTIQFNRPTLASTITVSSDPQENWSTQQVTNDSIVVSHELFLRVATPYTLTVLQDNQAVGTIAFETQHEQNDPRYLQSLQTQMLRNYPLANFTPYETAAFRVVYISPMALQISLKTFNVDSDTAVGLVKTWVQSHGGDPTAHKYLVIAPSPTPTPTPEPSPTD